MSIFKTAMAGVAALGVVLAGAAANAEPVRSAAATPGVVSVKKMKLHRTFAPIVRQSHEVNGTDVGLGILAGGAAGFGLYEATKGDSSGG